MNRARNRQIIELYRRGHSLREVGKRVHLSLERVRRIVREMAPWLIRRVGDTRNNSTGLTSSQRKSA